MTGIIDGMKMKERVRNLGLMGQEETNSEGLRSRAFSADAVPQAWASTNRYKKDCSVVVVCNEKEICPSIKLWENGW